MSLLDRNAPHTVWVQPRDSGRTADGLRATVPVGDPIKVRCKVEPVRDWSSAEEQYWNGLQIQDLRVVYARTWPADVHGFVLWQGQLYETVGQPQEFFASRRTRHFRITVQWVGKRDAERWPSTTPEE